MDTFILKGRGRAFEGAKEKNGNERKPFPFSYNECIFIKI